MPFIAIFLPRISEWREELLILFRYVIVMRRNYPGRVVLVAVEVDYNVQRNIVVVIIAECYGLVASFTTIWIKRRKWTASGIGAHPIGT